MLEKIPEPEPVRELKLGGKAPQGVREAEKDDKVAESEVSHLKLAVHEEVRGSGDS